VIAAACSADDTNIGSNADGVGGETSAEGGRENTGGREESGGTTPGGGAPGGEAGARNTGGSLGGSGGVTGGTAGEAGSAGSAPTCETVVYEGEVYKHLALEEYCSSNDCVIEGNETRTSFLCTDREERFQHERRVGCGLIEIHRNPSLWTERLFFDAETRALVGAYYVDDIRGRSPCESGAYVVGELPLEECAEAEVCNLCLEPQDWNDVPLCAPPECDTVRYRGQTRRHVSLEEYCAENDCPRTIEEAEARQQICSEGGALVRVVGCGLHEVTTAPFGVRISLFFDENGELVGAANQLGDNAGLGAGLTACESDLFAAGEVPARACSNVEQACAICNGNPIEDYAYCG
jgi:hypothetical protein